MKSHDIAPDARLSGVRMEPRPARGADGELIEGLHHVWIWLDNQSELNSYRGDRSSVPPPSPRRVG